MVSLNYRGIRFLWHLVLVPTTYQTQWAPQLVRVPLQPNKQLLLPSFFESAGAYLAGGEVTETIKSGVIDPTQFVEMPDVLALGMLSALFASGAWLFIATKWVGPFQVLTPSSEL